MEFIIDTVNLEEIKDALDHMPIVGVTSNPSIVKATSPQNFFDHMREIRKMIGKERSLHIQVISKDCQTMVDEAHRILKEIDEEVYVKIPVSYEGIKAIKILKSDTVKLYRYCKKRNIKSPAMVYNLFQSQFWLRLVPQLMQTTFKELKLLLLTVVSLSFLTK